MSRSQPALALLHGVVHAMRVRLGRPFVGVRGMGRPNALPLAVEGNPFPDRPRVMVADDDIENRLMLEALLYRWHIRPVHAADGAEAVALACGQRFDLILMDLQMPILNGLTATAQIRRFELTNDHPRAAVVAYSSSMLGDDWPMLQAGGFDESLDKPCSSHSLEVCLRRWCRSGLEHGLRAVPAR